MNKTLSPSAARRLLLLSLSLLLLLVSCISVPEIPDVSTKASEKTTSAVTAAPPPVLSFDEPDVAAGLFLNDPSGLVDVSKREYSYAELRTDLEALAAAHPSRFSYRSFGKSVAGRELYVCTLGNPDAQSQVLVSAGLHGREYLTPLLVMKQIEFYLTYYDVGFYGETSYADLFDSVCFYIVPMNNPDGIMLSQQGISSVTDPSLRNEVYNIYYSDFQAGLTGQDTIDGYLQYWKANIRGVDLNRNFDALWEKYFNYSKPSFAQYKGKEPSSEPETRALMELTDSLSNPLAVLCIHSQGEVLYWNCGQNESLLQDTYDLTQEIAKLNGYRVIEDKNNDASFSDWCALERDLIAITVETGSGLCPLDIDKFPPMWLDNYDLFAMTAAYFQK